MAWQLEEAGKEHPVKHRGVILEMPVAAITVSHLRGAVQHCHRNCLANKGTVRDL